MGQFKQTSLDQILFENVSVYVDGYDPILQSVDLELPMDQTIVVESSNPLHAVKLLEILAGRKAPQTGRVIWNELNLNEVDEEILPTQKLVGCYFEHQRPNPKLTMVQLFSLAGADVETQTQIEEQFEFGSAWSKSFKELTYELQKLVLLICATLNQPQMLILEDPATAITEKNFLNYLDWVQMFQRRGHLRHIFLTNHHPAALRHLDASQLFVEDGLIYFEDKLNFKKAVHF